MEGLPCCLVGGFFWLKSTSTSGYVLWAVVAGEVLSQPLPGVAQDSISPRRGICAAGGETRPFSKLQVCSENLGPAPGFPWWKDTVVACVFMVK